MHTEQRVALDDGAQTTLERWGDGDRRVLCIHGMTGSRKAWEDFAAAYGDRARIYAYDQRGHGDSAAVSGPMTLHRSLLDLYNVLGAIGEPVDTLIGHSWGGAIAILGGRRFDVKRVVAIDPMLHQGNTAWYDRFLRELKKDRAMRSAIKRLRDENPPQSWNLREDLEQYPKPLFLAVGEGAESLLTLEDLKFVRDRGGSQVALRVFEGHGHSPQRTDPERFIRELNVFFERTGAAP